MCRAIDWNSISFTSVGTKTEDLNGRRTSHSGFPTALSWQPVTFLPPVRLALQVLMFLSPNTSERYQLFTKKSKTTNFVLISVIQHGDHHTMTCSIYTCNRSYSYTMIYGAAVAVKIRLNQWRLFFRMFRSACSCATVHIGLNH